VLSTKRRRVRSRVATAFGCAVPIPCQRLPR
jgi:hypothetical protein